jgi:acetate kinase
MGFTPLDGLVMATRCGSVDPGLLLWLLEHKVASERELASSLEHESGLLAVAGTADMREILASQTPDADLAIDVFTHHLRAGIASMAAAMNGLDAVAFTGGIGQNSSEVRSRAIDRLGFLGLSLDPAGNDHGQADRDISSSGARARTIVVVSREDLEISRQVRDVCAPLRVSRSQL